MKKQLFLKDSIVDDIDSYVVSVLTTTSYTPSFPVDLLLLTGLRWSTLTVIVVWKVCFALVLEQCWQKEYRVVHFEAIAEFY